MYSLWRPLGDFTKLHLRLLPSRQVKIYRLLSFIYYARENPHFWPSPLWTSMRTYKYKIQIQSSPLQNSTNKIIYKTSTCIHRSFVKSVAPLNISPTDSVSCNTTSDFEGDTDCGCGASVDFDYERSHAYRDRWVCFYEVLDSMAWKLQNSGEWLLNCCTIY